MDQGETHMDKTIRNSLFYSHLFLKNMTQKKKRTWTKWYVILLLLFSSYTKSYLFILNLQSFWEFFGKQKRKERIYIYIYT
jgi:isoprenylcysteine carboxyl methyltransferase (ICMT) family protein YpbQ